VKFPAHRAGCPAPFDPINTDPLGCRGCEALEEVGRLVEAVEDLAPFLASDVFGVCFGHVTKKADPRASSPPDGNPVFESVAAVTRAMRELERLGV
jgi:hypothetical protein